MLEGLKGEESVSGICRREGIAPALYYRWSKDFLEAGKKRLMGDTMRKVAVYFGRDKKILENRKSIKKRTMLKRR